MKIYAEVLAAIGGINWGLAIFNFNLVTTLLGGIPYAVHVAYALIGLSGLYLLLYGLKLVK